MAALICGSLAYDTIMVFPDQFKNHILPDKVHILNVSFLVPRMRREFGGCAGNIAYNLKLLGGDPVPMATVGQDFGPYREHFVEQGINLSQVKVIDELFTPQAFITTDHDNNQITAFHPGAMMRSYENHVKDVKGVTFGIVSPDGREGMLQNATEFAEAGIPFIFDPGQAMPLFNGAELRHFIEQADYVTVNDYESNLLQERTGWSENEIMQRVKAYITTRGPHGWGGKLTQALGIGALPFSFAGLVVGSIVYSLPFAIQPLQRAFESVGPKPLEAAATLGAGPWDRFFSIALPLAKPGFVTAAVLSFAHTVGEFGVVLMLGGNIPQQTRVVSVQIYDHVEAMEYAQAHWLAGGMVVFSFTVLLLLNLLQRRERTHHRTGHTGVLG